MPGVTPKAAESEISNPQSDLRNPKVYRFRQVGRGFEIMFGGPAFYAPGTLGVRYSDFLLHRRQPIISAFDLEVVMMAEKGEARAPNSIQAESDGPALAAYRCELDRLKREKEQLERAGSAVGAALLKEIKSYQALLRARGGRGDTGDRARDNVRKAVWAFRRQLKKAGPYERALSEHLRTKLSLSHQCSYKGEYEWE